MKKTVIAIIILSMILSTVAFHYNDRMNLNDSTGPKIFSSGGSSLYLKYNEPYHKYAEYNINISWNQSKYCSLTENSIILKQGNNELLNITYGKQNIGQTVIKGNSTHKNTFSLARQNYIYSIKIVMSLNSHQSYIYINENNSEINIPYKINLSHPYINENLSIFFGGKYSYQKIYNVTSEKYSGIYRTSSSKMNLKSEKYNIEYKPLNKNNNAVYFKKTFSVFYLSLNYDIIKYNLYNHTSSVYYNNTLKNIKKASMINFNNSSYFYFISGNNVSIIKIYNNGSIKSSFVNINHTVSGMIIFDNYYVFYHNSTLYFCHDNSSKTVKLNGPIFRISTQNNLDIYTVKNNAISEYTINSNIVILHNITNERVNKNFNAITYFENNGISSFLYNNSSININGTIMNNFKNIHGNIFMENGEFYYKNNNTFYNTGINDTGYMSNFNNTFIVMSTGVMNLYTPNVYVPSNITIFYNTSVVKNVASFHIHLNSNVNSYTVFINNSVNVTELKLTGNTLNFNETYNKNGAYNINILIKNTIGMESYLNKTIKINYFTDIVLQKIKIINGRPVALINGTNLKNASIIWYVNGKYFGSGVSPGKSLPIGYDKITMEIKYHNNHREVTHNFIIVGNLPYYVSFSGVIAVLFIFLYNLYYSNKDVNSLINDIYGMHMKDALKLYKKNKISKLRARKFIKRMEKTGEISIEKDMDGKKFIILK